jgi:SAM-dependent methyltransferase
VRRELLIGCGNSRVKQVAEGERKEFEGLVTLDHKGDCGADVIHDLEVLPYPFETDEFDEIHAYDVLEHCGRQGDWRYFFAQWSEFHRILKPNGLFFGICPTPEGIWAWGDPSHTRIISRHCLGFLDQKMYARDVGNSSRSDFRSVYSCDFKVASVGDYDENRHWFVLQAIKE